jgi:hypothetical protein
VRLDASLSKLSFKPVRGSDAEKPLDRLGLPDLGEAEVN